MKFSASAAALALAATASAQSIPSVPSGATNVVSPQCLQTIAQLAFSPAASCINLQGLAPLLSTNGSIVPVLDQWMTGLCSGSPCTNATLANVTQAIGSACSSDLAKVGATNETLSAIVAQYPLAREILCLKTTQPANFTNATIPLTSPPYNLTNGTFCVTSLLTEISAYTGVNLTTSALVQTAQGGLQSAEQLVAKIPESALCNDCIFGAVDLVLAKYPQVANVSLYIPASAVNGTAPIPGLMNGTMPMPSMMNSTTGSNNATIGSLVNGICPSNYTWTTNGTLPSTLRPTAYNSTFQYNITVGNMTYAPQNVSARSFIDVTAAKRRMVGQRV